MSAATKKKVGFPPQIKYIVGNEAAERFSYYGMRSILFIFMVQYLAMSEATGKSVYHAFIAAAYFLPLVGAFIADRYWGKYKTIFYFSIVYCAGHAALAIWENKMGLYLGLGLIAVGTGAIKPCVSAFVGDQFDRSNAHLLEKVFDLFYFSINFGAFFSSLLIPWMLPKFGPGWAFGVPGILMGLATVFLVMGKRHYIHVPVHKSNGAGFMNVMWYAIQNQSQRKKGQGFLDVAKKKFKTEEVEAVDATWGVIKIFSTVAMFWALFDQQGSSWTNQARQMNLHFMGMDLLPSQIQALNPIMVMILIPTFSLGIYPFISKLGIKVTPLRKMSAGMVLAGSSFIIMGIYQGLLDSGVKLNVGWQFIPYLILTAAEIMVSITGLEFAYTQAPRSMKSTIMSFWLLTVFAGNFLAAIVSSWNKFQGDMEFHFYGVLMMIVSLIFIFAATRYKERNFVEKKA